jgi:hypothetical protein
MYDSYYTLIFNITRIANMKRIIQILLITMLFSHNSYASRGGDFCTAVSNASELVMRSRQEGKSMSHLMNIETGSEITDGILEADVYRAFEIQRFSSQYDRDDAIETFRDDAYMKCYKFWIKNYGSMADGP